MKKKLIAVSLSAMLALSALTPVFAAQPINATPAYIQYNGEFLKNKAYLSNGSTYIKAADVNTIFGAQIVITNANASIIKGDLHKTLLTPVINGDMVTLRSVAEALGLSIGWDEEYKAAVIVDVNKIVREKGTKFDLMKKYIDYTLSRGEAFKVNGNFDGSVEVNNGTGNIIIPFEGSVEGKSSYTKEDVTMKMSIGLENLKSILYSALASDKSLDDESKKEMETLLSAFESSETRYMTDTEKGIIYVQSPLLNKTLGLVKGIAPNAWISIDLNSMMNSVPSSSAMDIQKVIKLIQNGELDRYILETLKSMPVSNVNSYEEISTVYDMISNMMGDSAFRLEDGKYVSSLSLNESGSQLVYTMSLGTEGDEINACTIRFIVNAEGAHFDISASSDKNLNSSVTLRMDAANMFKMNLNMTSSLSAIANAPEGRIPAGIPVIPLEELMTPALPEVPAVPVLPEKAEGSVDIPVTEVVPEA